MRKYDTHWVVAFLFTLTLSCNSAQERPQIEYIQVPAGTFTMGYNPVEVDTGLIRLMNIDTGEITYLENDKPPQRLVDMQPFKMSKFEITFDQYDRFCDATGRAKPDDNGWGRGKRPVINVSWFDASEFARWMGARLPTETEWEYACRAGTGTPYHTGMELHPGQASFLNEGSLLSTAEVGSYAPNNFGLFDMHGNVAEWCDNNGTDSISFPKRGGSWSNTAEEARSWVGGIYVEGSQGYTNIGFRIVWDQ